MKRFFTNRIALSFAAVGIALTVLTLVWHVNPVEGSVVPRFLRESLVGQGIWWILFVTSMPGWIVSLFLARFLESDQASAGLPGWSSVFGLIMIISQGVVYFLLGTAVSFVARKLAKNIEAEAKPASGSEQS